MQKKKKKKKKKKNTNEKEMESVFYQLLSLFSKKKEKGS